MTNFAGGIGAMPTTRINHPLLMSPYVIGNSHRVVVRLERNPVRLSIDGLLDEEEESAAVDVLPLRSMR